LLAGWRVFVKQGQFSVGATGIMINRLLLAVLLLGYLGLWPSQTAAQTDALPSRQQADSVLRLLPEQLKHIDEPVLRISLCLRIATYLWAEQSQEHAKDAEALTKDAIADLQANENNMPELYSRSFRADMLALLNQRAPALAARLAKDK
jgi:hypothetical protein